MEPNYPYLFRNTDFIREEGRLCQEVSMEELITVVAMRYLILKYICKILMWACYGYGNGSQVKSRGTVWCDFQCGALCTEFYVLCFSNPSWHPSVSLLWQGFGVSTALDFNNIGNVNSREIKQSSCKVEVITGSNWNRVSLTPSSVESKWQIY